MVKDCTILFRKWLTEISVEENCLKQELLLQLPDIYLGGRKLDHYVIKLSEIGHGCSPVRAALQVEICFEFDSELPLVLQG